MVIKIVAIVIGMILFISSYGYAGSSICNTNPIVKAWIKERNNYATAFVRKWASGVENKNLAPILALAWVPEAKITAECRKDIEFLKRNRLFYGNSDLQMTIDTAPGVIIEWIIKNDYLSPERQYRLKKKEVILGQNEINN